MKWLARHPETVSYESLSEDVEKAYGQGHDPEEIQRVCRDVGIAAASMRALRIYQLTPCEPGDPRPAALDRVLMNLM